MPQSNVLRPPLGSVLRAPFDDGWTPRNLGNLNEWWDAENLPSFTFNGSAVSAWKGRAVGVVASQAVAGSQPGYSATAFNGKRPGVTFDGVADELTAASVLSGATAGELWALVDQTAAAADTTTRVAFSTGSSAASKRELARVVASGTNRARAATFDGSTTPTAQDTTVDFSGVHLIRAIFAPLLLTLEIDGVVTSTVITGNSTGSGRTRIGANPVSTAGNFFQGVGNSFLAFNGLLSLNEANQMSAYFNARRV